jgi:hypothetical protein
MIAVDADAPTTAAIVVEPVPVVHSPPHATPATSISSQFFPNPPLISVSGNTELEPRSMMTRSRSLRVNLKRKIPERDGVAAGSEPEDGPATVKRIYFPPRPLVVGSGSRNLLVGTGKMSRTRPPPVRRPGELQSLSQLHVIFTHAMSSAFQFSFVEIEGRSKEMISNKVREHSSSCQDLLFYFPHRSRVE